MAAMTAALVELYRHNLWANLRLLDACTGLGDEHLDASAPGTYGRVRDTLVHLFAAEERYVALLSDQRPERPLSERDPFPGFEELRERARRSGEALIEIAGQTPADRVLRGTWRDGPYAIKATVPLVQAINHATEHRAHVMTILTQRGVGLPDIDGWAYEEATSERGATGEG